MDEAIKKLVDLFMKEYNDKKAELNYYKNSTDHLTNLNESLRCAERDNAEAFARLKELIAPKITWDKDSPMYLSLFNTETLKEVCKILKIERPSKN